MNVHINKIMEYCYEDELKSFEQTFLTEEFDEVTHVFTYEQRDSIFYALHMLPKQNKADLEIRKVLVLSTGHLVKKTLEVSQSHKNWICDHEYGAYFHVGDVGNVTPFEDPEDYPGDLYRCLLFARDHGCYEVKFDRDGPVMEGLPTYEW